MFVSTMGHTYYHPLVNDFPSNDDNWRVYTIFSGTGKQDVVDVYLVSQL